MLIFHSTWLLLLKGHPIAQKAYDESKYQEGLAKFIRENLAEYVYKGLDYGAEKPEGTVSEEV